jgi:hypothetical protein
MLLMLPQLWLIILPGNFLIDSLVLIISMYALKMTEKKQWYRQHILKIFLFGMLSDLIGAAYLFLMAYVFELGIMGDELYLTGPALLIAAAMIFVFNYYVTFKKDAPELRTRFSLIFAIATAPYTFLIPSSWIYQF